MNSSLQSAGLWWDFKTTVKSRLDESNQWHTEIICEFSSLCHHQPFKKIGHYYNHLRDFHGFRYAEDLPAMNRNNQVAAAPFMSPGHHGFAQLPGGTPPGLHTGAANVGVPHSAGSGTSVASPATSFASPGFGAGTSQGAPMGPINGSTVTDGATMPVTPVTPSYPSPQQPSGYPSEANGSTGNNVPRDVPMSLVDRSTVTGTGGGGMVPTLPGASLPNDMSFDDLFPEFSISGNDNNSSLWGELP
ncbi:hypothetical protein F5X98DRAFT_327557 [Xylaria grammica]|nr:hypothetical protein F5X98DRAFT_327557 [Xylaria grammica]